MLADWEIAAPELSINGGLALCLPIVRGRGAGIHPVVIRTIPEKAADLKNTSIARRRTQFFDTEA